MSTDSFDQTLTGPGGAYFDRRKGVVCTACGFFETVTRHCWTSIECPECMTHHGQRRPLVAVWLRMEAR